MAKLNTFELMARAGRGLDPATLDAPDWGKRDWGASLKCSPGQLENVF